MIARHAAHAARRPSSDAPAMIGVETLRIAWGGILANKLRSGAHDPRHDDRRRLGDHPDRRRQRLLQSRRGTHREPRHQRAAGRVRRDRAAGAPSRSVGGASSTVSLTKQDAAALQNLSRSPRRQERRARRQRQPASRSSTTAPAYEPGTFVGTTPSYLIAHGYHLQEGAAFTEADVAHHARVAVIGQTVAEELFPGQAPSGRRCAPTASTSR